MNKKELKNGYTTGSTATAAAKAAAYYITSSLITDNIAIKLPDETILRINIYKDKEGIYAVKDGGDDIDATHGIKIYSKAVKRNDKKVIINGGKGIGIVTKKGLSVPVGEYAINPVPRKMIEENVLSVIPDGAEIFLWIPEGEKIAEKTFNSNLGIIGGISIIGTTGVVEPMSIDALKASIDCELNVLAAENHKKICLTPGKTGIKAFKNIDKTTPCVLMSNYVGYTLTEAYKRGINDITISGHPGKLGKIAMGYFDTHSRTSPQAQNYIAAAMGLENEFNTVEEICTVVSDMSLVAQKIKLKIASIWKFNSIKIYLFDMKGNKIGES